MYYVKDDEISELLEGNPWDSHTLPNGEPDDCHLNSKPAKAVSTTYDEWINETVVTYYGTDLEAGMTLYLDGLQWLIEHVFPYVKMEPGTVVPVAYRDATKTVVHVSTFIRRQGQHHAAYVVNNADAFQVIL
jgi:hypothetical protein